jgi:hypothetical protein
VRLWSCVRELKAAVVGRGIDSLIVTSRGIKSSMNSSSGGTTKGENKGYAKDWRSRAWCIKCVESAECAVISLHIR